MEDPATPTWTTFEPAPPLLTITIPKLVIHTDHRSPNSPTMENPVDRSIRLLAVAAGVVSLLVYAVFHFV